MTFDEDESEEFDNYKQKLEDGCDKIPLYAKLASQLTVEQVYICLASIRQFYQINLDDDEDTFAPRLVSSRMSRKSEKRG